VCVCVRARARVYVAFELGDVILLLCGLIYDVAARCDVCAV